MLKSRYLLDWTFNTQTFWLSDCHGEGILHQRHNENHVIFPYDPPPYYSDSLSLCLPPLWERVCSCLCCFFLLCASRWFFHFISTNLSFFFVLSSLFCQLTSCLFTHNLCLFILRKCRLIFHKTVVLLDETRCKTITYILRSFLWKIANKMCLRHFVQQAIRPRIFITQQPLIAEFRTNLPEWTSSSKWVEILREHTDNPEILWKMSIPEMNREGDVEIIWSWSEVSVVSFGLKRHEW